MSFHPLSHCFVNDIISLLSQQSLLVNITLRALIASCLWPPHDHNLITLPREFSNLPLQVPQQSLPRRSLAAPSPIHQPRLVPRHAHALHPGVAQTTHPRIYSEDAVRVVMSRLLAVRAYLGAGSWPGLPSAAQISTSSRCPACFSRTVCS